MNGHQTPRRASAGPHALPPRQSSPKKRLFPRSFSLLLVLLAALTAGALLFAAGCGSDGADDVESTTTTAAVTTTSARPTSTTAPASADAFPVTVTDDNGNTVTIAAKPERIVSTAPASTETLFALGLGDLVVGVTSLDDYPPEVADITKVGDFQANTEAIMALSPDLVIGYSGNEEALAPVQAAGAAVVILNPATVDGIYSNITLIGEATGATQEAAALVESLQAQIKEVSDAAAATGESPRVFYALDNTLWTCGPGSFVDELLGLASCTNVASKDIPAGAMADAYYQFSPEQLVAADPEIILLPSSSGYSSAEEFTSDSRFAGLTAVKEGQVFLFDDTTLTRPGPRVGEGLGLLVATVHPGGL